MQYKLTSASPWTSAGSVTGQSKTISGLTNGTSYHVQVQACNVVGCGAWSASQTGTPRTVPDKVSTPELTGRKEGLSVDWDAPWHGGAAITSYYVQYKETDADSWSSGGSISVTSKTILYLTPGETYYVQVRAKNVAGYGDWSDSATGKVPTPPGQVSTPTGTGGNGSLDASWGEPDENGGSAVTYYGVRYKVTTASSWTDGGWIAGTTKTIYGLTKGTSYHVQVKACNVAGCGLWSSSATIRVPTTPGEVKNLTLTEGNHSLTANWVVPDDNGGSAVTYYSVQHRLSPAGSWSSSDLTAALTKTIYGLANGSPYDVRVQACNVAGCGSWSVEDGTPQSDDPPSPPAPTGVSADATGETTIDVSWSSISGVSHYKLERSPSGTSQWTEVNANISGTSWPADGLACNTAYYFQVKAYGDGTNHASEFGPPSSGSVSATTSPCPDAPAPDNLTVTSSDDDSVSLGWGAVSGAYRYRVERSPNGNDGWSTLSSTITGPSYTDNPVTCNTTYYYRVSARGDGSPYSTNWSAASGNVSITPSCPVLPAPENLTVTSSDDDSVNLGWDAVSGAHRYRVERSLNGNSGWSALSSTITGPSYTDTTVTCNTTYYYRVRVRGDGYPHSTNWSAASGNVSITPSCPLAPPPENLTVTSSDDDSVSLGWDAVAGAYYYKIERRLSGSTNWVHQGYRFHTDTTYTANGAECGTHFRVRTRGDGHPYSTTYGGGSSSVTRGCGPTVTIAAVQSPVTEGGHAQFTLTASSAPSSSLQVTIQVTESGSFLTGTIPGTVTIAADATSADLSLQTDDDEVYEDNGSVTVTIQEGDDYEASEDSASATVSVENNDPPGPPTNLSLHVHGTDEHKLVVFYAHSGPPHYYRFELYWLNSQSGAYTLAWTGETSNVLSVETASLIQGETYKARGRNCLKEDRTECGAWSDWSDPKELPVPPLPTPGAFTIGGVKPSDRTTIVLNYALPSSSYYYEGTLFLAGSPVPDPDITLIPS